MPTEPASPFEPIRPFKQVDVFTAVPFMGNPVAVILDADGLSAEQMQAIARWTNLSETTFVTKATVTNATGMDADYAVRIFTPVSELPFAGHPTLGTAHAVLEAGLASWRAGKIVQECAVGLVEISQTEAGLSFRLPRYACTVAPEPEILAQALGGDDAIIGIPQIVDVGPRWAIVEMAEPILLEQLVPDLALLADYERTHATTGLTIFAQCTDGSIGVRSFAPADGIAEDPVCGSGNGAVAAYRLMMGQVSDGSHYRASQGRQVQRDGKIDIRIHGADIHVGGQCVTIIDGGFRA